MPLCKQKILYFGIDESRFDRAENVTLFPLIKIIPRPFEEVKEVFEAFFQYTHLLFTSRSAVKIFFENCAKCGISQEEVASSCRIAVGKATGALLGEGTLIAKEAHGEGLIDLLKTLSLQKAHLFFPHSSLSRSLIADYLLKEKILFSECVLYDTISHVDGPLPTLEDFEELVFTSPSSVVAFMHFFGKVPSGIKVTAIGPITQKSVEKILGLSYRDF